MKHIIAATLLAAASLMAHTGASAQSKLQATIPFDFTVGNDKLPAGTYVMEYVQPHGIMLSCRAKQKTIFTLFTSIDEVRQTPNKVVFNRYGNQYFLREIRGSYGQNSWNLGASKREKQVQVEEASRGTQERSLVALK
jgi:hypothetical protein